MNGQTPSPDVSPLPADDPPEKLSICCWIWNWIVMATPGEPYDDLGRCMRAMKERGFNCLRAETGVNWAFRVDGTPRGPMGFGPWIAGHGSNLSSVNARGGGRHDVLERLMLLMELAAQHDIRVILTSWEYQDSSWFVADPAIRREVFAVAPEDRFMHLARQFDRLLRLLREQGLLRNIAFVEIHNEPDASEFPAGDAIFQPVACPAQTSRELHEVAIGFLRERHPDVLVSADLTTHNYELTPDNAQVFDQHVYAGYEWYTRDLYGQTVNHPQFDPYHPRKTEPLRALLRDDSVPWDEYMKPAQNIRAPWRARHWLYDNLDNAKWDAWVADRYAGRESRILLQTEQCFAADAAEARRRGLPQVFDEGGLFYPPRMSRFELSPTGLAVLELMADLAIRYEYWGFMPGTYCGPEHLIWHENPKWLKRINDRFRNGSRQGRCPRTGVVPPDCVPHERSAPGRSARREASVRADRTPGS